MIVAGILAVLVILFSPTFQRETSSYLSEKASTEKSAESEKRIVAVPSDAVTSSQAGEVERVNPFVVQEIIDDTACQSIQPILGRTLISAMFKTLLRTVISPQAP